MCPQPSAPSRFGQYRLLERIAVGGTAEVFRARLLFPDGSEEPVVLKKVLPQHARDPRLREVFREEALVLASLEHPNIIRLRDFGELQGTLFLALEQVDGADLDTLLVRSRSADLPLRPSLAAYLALQVCLALEYIHTRRSASGTPLQIVHRDISPHNIIVSVDGEVKLADFGIARSVIRSDKTVDGCIKGKLLYMAPEQAISGAPIDARADLFALGAVLYEMVFQRAAFAAPTDVEVLERVRTCRCQIEWSWLPPEHHALLEVISRCLQRRPEQRWPSARAVADHLERYLAEVQADEPADAGALARWVASLEQSVADESGEMVRLLLRGEASGRGSTAVMRVAPTPGSTVVRADARDPLPRVFLQGWRLAGVLLLVAVLASGLTAVVLGRGGRAPGRPDGSTSSRLVVGRATAGPASRPSRASSRAVASPASAAVRPQPLRAAAPRLRLRSRPAGASVRIDGELLGRTPLEVGAPARSCKVTVELPGRQRWERRLPVLSEDLTLEAVLAPRAYGWLTINSVPWSMVYLDGRRVGPTPQRNLRATGGAHRVVLRDSSGVVLRTFDVRLAPGERRLLTYEQKARP